MFRTIWDWLEIDETRDRNLIRKAYARQAKKYHPEDKPEEARQLREAYKKALALAAKEKDTGFHDDCDAPENTDNGYQYDPETQKEMPEVPPEKGDNGYRYDPGMQKETPARPA